MKRTQPHSGLPILGRLRARHTRSRRGALLLVVLSILVLFALIGITYVVTAGAYNKGATAYKNRDPNHDDPIKEIDAVALQILRGPRPGSISAIQGHDLLGDMYGNETVRAEILTIVARSSSSNPGPGTIGTPVDEFMKVTVRVKGNAKFVPVLGYYSGCVMTFLDGNGKGKSVRIIGYEPIRDLADPPGVYKGQRGLFLVDHVSHTKNRFKVPEANDIVLINGRPFSGVGRGLAASSYSASANLDLTYKNRPVALLPNHSLYAPAGTIIAGNANSGKRIDLGGADEPYDAPDYQNMVMSYYAQPVPANSSEILPSFHRQDLIAYWAKRESGLTDDLKRLISLRPLKIDHPRFTGSNPNPNTTEGFKLFDPNPNPVYYWDVDNDGNNVPDSIWIDPGLPVKTDREGRRYKVLSAILVKDMGGRLNLNAHGFASALPAPLVAPTNLSGYVPPGLRPKVGMGYGPADVDLYGLFSANVADYANVLASRYGPDNRPGRNGILPPPANPADPNPGNDALSQLFSVGIMENYQNQAFGGYYGSYAHVTGSSSTVSDFSGRPFHYARPSGGITEIVDEPYELNLVGSDATDEPYTAQELERVLRYNDVDAYAIPSRLPEIANNTFRNPANRNLVTTHSYQVPSLPVPPIPRDLRTAFNPTGPNKFPPPLSTTPLIKHPLALSQIDRPVDEFGVAPTIIDLARERVRREYHQYLVASGSTLNFNEARINDIVKATMPWELFRGEPMDLNRPFESPRVQDAYSYNDKIKTNFFGGRANYNLTPHYMNDYDIPGLFGPRNLAFNIKPLPAGVFNKTYAKQLYARHLYCLMMLLKDKEFTIEPFTSDETTSGPLRSTDIANRKELTARRIAQWAINVVDYRDYDAVMTPFEYDLNPFNGWMVDGDPLTDETTTNNPERRIIWGTETPDLLLTETLALHNRRTKDTAFDTGGEGRKRATAAPKNDTTLDQYRIPQGSLFIELFTTRNFKENLTKLPTELYTPGGQLELGKVTGDNSPVWRMVVTQNIPDPNTPPTDNLFGQAKTSRPNLMLFQPTDPGLSSADPAKFNPLNKSAASDPSIEIDRMILFTTATLPASLARFDEISFRYRGNATNANLQLNEFTVIGPRNITSLGARPATTSSDSAAINEDGDQFIDLSGGAVTYNTPVVADAYPAKGTEIRNNRSLICSMLAPTTWSAPNTRVGLNVSEPLTRAGASDYYNGADYYPEPTLANGHYTKANPTDDTIPAPPEIMASDIPFDTDPSGAARPLRLDYAPNADGTPNNTHENYKSVLLQRLADPNRNYHESLNPYITVDWKPIDLHVFNGEDHAPATGALSGSAFDPDDTNDPNVAGAVTLATRQAGRRNGDQQSGVADGHLFGMFKDNLEDRADMELSDWDAYGAMNPTPRDTAAVTGFPGDHFARPLKHTLGYSNYGYGARLTSASSPDEKYVGMPNQGPFGWIHHPNRPLISKYELLNVPASAPQRLLYENTMFPTTAPSDEQYGSEGGNQAKEVTGRFGGLLNFFHSGERSDSTRRSHFYRLFDYVTVPSRFVGTQKHYKSDFFDQPDAGANDLRRGLRYPFAKRSEFREPGIINLNTMVSNKVFEAIYNPNYWTANAKHAHYEHVKKSVLGHGSGSYDPAARDYPSWFANPFRPSGVAEMTPENATKVSGVNSTPLRSGELFDGTNLAAAIPDPDPAAPDNSIAANEGAGDDEPLFRFDTSANLANNHYRNTQKNPMFRYQGMQRLGNLTGYQSNVYAVWVTIGYFEVKQVGVSSAIPDGWQLGAELGLDTGDINRHRGFYIMDRSIPVGYEPGEDHNTDDAILVRRFIE